MESRQSRKKTTLNSNLMRSKPLIVVADLSLKLSLQTLFSGFMTGGRGLHTDNDIYCRYIRKFMAGGLYTSKDIHVGTSIYL